MQIDTQQETDYDVEPSIEYTFVDDFSHIERQLINEKKTQNGNCVCIDCE